MKIFAPPIPILDRLHQQLGQLMQFVETEQEADFLIQTFIDKKDWVVRDSKNDQIVVPPTDYHILPYNLIVLHNRLLLKKLTIGSSPNPNSNQNPYKVEMRRIKDGDTNTDTNLSIQTNQIFEQEYVFLRLSNNSPFSRFFHVLYLSEGGIVKNWGTVEIPPNETSLFPNDPKKIFWRFTIDPFTPDYHISMDELIVVVSDQATLDFSSFESKGYILTCPPESIIVKQKNTNFALENNCFLSLPFKVLRSARPTSLEQLCALVKSRVCFIIYRSEIISPVLYNVLKKPTPSTTQQTQTESKKLKKLGKLEILSQEIQEQYTLSNYKPNIFEICLKVKNI